MKTVEYFRLAEDYKMRGDIRRAVEVWDDIVKEDPNITVFTATHINLADHHKQTGNLIAERNHLLAFLNAAHSAITMEMIPSVKTRLKDIENKMNPKPQEKK